jgi:hypothetical protein
MKAESKIQSDCHVWLWSTHPQTRRLCYAIPNGGSRDIREAVALKAQGVVAGMPDYHVAIKGNLGLTLYVEFKRPGEVPRPEQIKVHEQLTAAGHAVYVIDNEADFKKTVLEHIKGTPYEINT